MAKTGSELQGVPVVINAEADKDPLYYDDDDDGIKMTTFLDDAKQTWSSEVGNYTRFSLPERPLGQGKHGAAYEITHRGVSKVLKLAPSIELPGLHKEWCFSRALELKLTAEEQALFTLTEDNFFVFKYKDFNANAGTKAIQSLKSLAQNLKAHNAVFALGTLQPLASRGPLETLKNTIGLEQKASMLLSAARGLAAMHRLNFRHHDVKPENIFVSGTGQAMIGDLGAATIAKPDGKSSLKIEWNWIDDMRRFGLTMIATFLNLPWGGQILHGVPMTPLQLYCARNCTNPTARDPKEPEYPSVAEVWEEFFEHTVFTPEAKFGPGTLKELWEKHVEKEPSVKRWHQSKTPLLEIIRGICWCEYDHMDKVVSKLEDVFGKQMPQEAAKKTSFGSGVASEPVGSKPKPKASPSKIRRAYTTIDEQGPSTSDDEPASPSASRRASITRANTMINITGKLSGSGSKSSEAVGGYPGRREVMPETVHVQGFPTRTSDYTFLLNPVKSKKLSAQLGEEVFIYGHYIYDLVIPTRDMGQASLYKFLRPSAGGKFDLDMEVLAAVTPAAHHGAEIITVTFPGGPKIEPSKTDDGKARGKVSRGLEENTTSGLPRLIVAKYKTVCDTYEFDEVTQEQGGAELAVYKGARKELLIPVGDVRAAEVWNTDIDMCVAAIAPKNNQEAHLTLVIRQTEINHQNCLKSLNSLRRQADRGG